MVACRLMRHYAPPLATDSPEQHLTYGGLNPNLALFSGVLKALPTMDFICNMNLSEFEG